MSMGKGQGADFPVGNGREIMGSLSEGPEQPGLIWVSLTKLRVRAELSLMS